MANRYWYPDTTSGTGTGNWSATGATGHWADDAAGLNVGGAAPTSSDSAFFGSTAFNGAGQTVTVDSAGVCLAVSFVGSTNTPTLSLGANTLSISGAGTVCTFISAMVATGTTGALDFVGGGYGNPNQAITTDGLSLGLKARVNSVGGTLTLNDGFTFTNTFTVSKGTWVTNNKTVTGTSNIVANSGFAKVLTLGSSVITTTQAEFGTSALTTVNAGTSTINCSGYFDGGSQGFNILNMTGATGTLVGNNTMNTLGLMRAGVQTITATGTTQTFKSLIRNAGKQVKTLVNGTYTRLPGGGVNLDYMSISGSTATTALYAGPLTHSTDGGGNTGWVFQCNPECRISRMRRYLAAGVV